MKILLPDNYVKPKLPGRDKWIEALRSGEYRKGHGVLCHRDIKGEKSYCCLGILSKLQGRLIDGYDGVNGDYKSSTYLSKDNPLIDVLSTCGSLPIGVLVDGKNTSLANCNDSDFTFKEIAEIIETVWDNS